MKYILITCFSLFFLQGFGQMKGVVYGKSVSETKEPLFGVRVKSLQNPSSGVFTEEDGTFEIILGKQFPDTLVFTVFGFRNDTLIVSKKDRFSLYEINLMADSMLDEFVVEGKREHHGIMKLQTLHVEMIGEGELRKAACCNLSESFETNASVDVNITDAVSGAKKIQMMGLDGVYTQIQMENIPYMRGLESAFGLGSMPGTWVESIQITKGTGNVVNEIGRASCRERV